MKNIINAVYYLGVIFIILTVTNKIVERESTRYDAWTT
jgi:hypothetical protein